MSIVRASSISGTTYSVFKLHYCCPCSSDEFCSSPRRVGKRAKPWSGRVRNPVVTSEFRLQDSASLILPTMTIKTKVGRCKVVPPSGPWTSQASRAILNGRIIGTPSGRRCSICSVLRTTYSLTEHDTFVLLYLSSTAVSKTKYSVELFVSHKMLKALSPLLVLLQSVVGSLSI